MAYENDGANLGPTGSETVFKLVSRTQNDLETGNISLTHSPNSDEPTSSISDTQRSTSMELNCFQTTWIKLSNLFTFDGNNDAKACALIKIPEACTWAASSVYLSAAIVESAYEAAGCISEIPEGESELPECDKRIYGIKPSSILSLFIMILGLVCAVLMPVIGALLDSSNKRRLVGGLTALVVTALTFAQSFISKTNWFSMLILQLFSFVTMTVNSCVALAYLPELSNDTTTLARYNTIIMIFSSVAIVIFLVAMTFVSSFFASDDSIKSAKIALLITFVLQCVFYGISWTKLFGAREGNQKTLPDTVNDANKSCLVLRHGMQSLKRTFSLAFKQRAAVRYFLAFKATSQPVYVAFTAATLSYINEHLQVSPRDLGITTLIVLASAIPGNKLSLTLMQRVNPLKTMQLCISLWALLGGIFVLFVNKPGQEMRLFIIAIIWGLLMGLKEPVDKTILCNLIPSGIEAEMSGLYISSSQLFMWLPPLVFTIMNENGIPFQAALASFGAYFLVGLLFLFLMGSYESMMATHEMDHNYAVELRRRAGTRSMSEGDLTSFFAYDARSSCHIVPPRRPLRTTTGSATTRGRSLQNSRSHSSFAGLYDRDRARLSFDD